MMAARTVDDISGMQVIICEQLRAFSIKVMIDEKIPNVVYVEAVHGNFVWQRSMLTTPGDTVGQTRDKLVKAANIIITRLVQQEKDAYLECGFLIH